MSSRNRGLDVESPVATKKHRKNPPVAWEASKEERVMVCSDADLENSVYMVPTSLIPSGLANRLHDDMIRIPFDCRSKEEIIADRAGSSSASSELTWKRFLDTRWGVFI